MDRVVARNIVWNWAGMAANMVSGFVVAPFLVHRLGHTVYGLWILIASLIYYFGLLDMGVRGAVGRQIAYYRAKNDQDGVNATLNTALAILCCAGVLAMLGTLAAVFVFFRIFDVPPDQVHSVRMALFLIGLNLILWLPLNLFDALLWAYQRFDLINAVDINGAVLRTVLTFYLVGRGYGLVALSLIHLLTLAGTQLLKAAVAFRLDSTLRLGFRHLNGAAARSLLGIGFWNTLLSLAYVANGQIGPLIIGARMGVQLVTPYSIAARLMAYGRDFLVASTGVLTPVAITNHAEERHNAQRRLFIEGGKYCLALSLIFLTLFVVLGRPFIHLWMGPDLEWAWQLLLILSLGEALPMAQWVSYSIILGKYRHRWMACVATIENVVAIALAISLVGRWGVAGICVAFAIPRSICRGIVQLVYTCRLVSVPLWTYVNVVVVPVTAAAALPAAGLYALTRWHVPATWWELLAYGAGYGMASVLMIAGLFGYGWWRMQSEGRAVEPPPGVIPGSAVNAVEGIQ